MQDIVYGILAILAGSFFCFRGQVVLRLVIPIWGAFAGFSLGAGLVSGATGDGFLSTVMGWVVGLALAFVFALFAYLYYAVGVIIAMGSIGFALGATLIVALGMEWNWAVILSGIVVGALVAVLAIAADIPMFLLIVLSSFGGASVAVAGLMLLFGDTESADFDNGAIADQIHDHWWWYLIFLVMAIAGVLSQSRDGDAARRSTRASWS